MTKGEKIRVAREAIGMTQSDLAQALRTTKQTIYKYESDIITNIPSDKLERACEVLGVSPAYIMGWEETDVHSFTSDVELIKQEKGKRIPILGTIAAGSPIWADENIEGYTYTDRNGGADYFALRVRGDSMNALGIQDGALVTIRKQPEVENGEIAAVLLNGEEATLKRYIKTGDTITLMPQSTNPANMPMIFSAKKDKIEVLGLAVEVKFSLC